MDYTRTLPLGGLVGVLAVALVGCSAAPTLQPSTPAPTEPKTARAPRERSQQKKATGRKAPRSSQPSSLEAFRRGEGLPTYPPGGGVSPLKDIYFEFDRSNLRADTRETLKRNFEWLKANPGVRVEVEGHADERGTNEYNLALGARRSQGAKDYLLSLGLAPDRVSTISYGEELPVCREKAEECWHKNRRGHFVVITVRSSS